MAVTLLDATTNSGQQTVFPGNTYTFAKTCSAGSDRVLEVTVQWANGTNQNVTGVTYGGQTMTSAGAAVVLATVGIRKYYLEDAGITAASSTDIVVQWNDTPDHGVISARVWAGVDSVTAYTTSSGSSGGTASIAPTGATADDYSSGSIICSDIMTPTAGTSQFNISGSKFYADSIRAGATNTMTWTFSSSEFWAANGLLFVGVGVADTALAATVNCAATISNADFTAVVRFAATRSCAVTVSADLTAGATGGAVALLDATTHSGQVTVFPGNALTLVKTVSAGTQRALVATVHWANGTGTAIASVTYGGMPMILAGQASVAAIYGTARYYLLETNLALAANTNLIVTWVSTPDYALVSARSYTAVLAVNGYQSISSLGSAVISATQSPITANDYSELEVTAHGIMTPTTGTVQYNVSGLAFYADSIIAGSASTIGFTFGASEFYSATALRIQATAAVQINFNAAVSCTAAVIATTALSGTSMAMSARVISYAEFNGSLVALAADVLASSTFLVASLFTAPTFAANVGCTATAQQVYPIIAACACSVLASLTTSIAFSGGIVETTTASRPTLTGPPDPAATTAVVQCTATVRGQLSGAIANMQAAVRGVASFLATLPQNRINLAAAVTCQATRTRSRLRVGIVTHVNGKMYDPNGVLLTSGQLLIRPRNFIQVGEYLAGARAQITYTIPDDGNVSIGLVSSDTVPYIVEYDPTPSDDSVQPILKERYFADIWTIPDVDNVNIQDLYATADPNAPEGITPVPPTIIILLASATGRATATATTLSSGGTQQNFTASVTCRVTTSVNTLGSGGVAQFFLADFETNLTSTFNSQQIDSLAGQAEFVRQNTTVSDGTWSLQHNILANVEPGFATQHFGVGPLTPIYPGTEGQTYTDVYLQYRVRYSSGFNFNVQFKQFIMGTADDHVHESPNPWCADYLTIFVTAGGTLSAEFNKKNVETGANWVDIPCNLASGTLTTGVWHTIEIHKKLNTGSASDGVFEMWLDNVKVANYTNLQYRVAYAGTHGTNLTYGINFLLLSDYGFLPASNGTIYYDNITMSRSRINGATGNPGNPDVPLGTGPLVIGAPRLPGMDGRAMYGNNGTPTIFRVTSLADTGVGTLRAALESTIQNRCVIFEICGDIILNSDIVINTPYITIAGQTAPGKGICVRRYGIIPNTHDVLIQHLKLRKGQIAGNIVCGNNLEAYGGSPYNVVLDHCSISWGQDENVIFYNPTRNMNSSMWRCLVYEGLFFTPGTEQCGGGGASGGHGLLVYPGTKGVTIAQCVFAKNHERNPNMQGDTHVVLVNNIVFGWHAAEGFLFVCFDVGGSFGLAWRGTAVGNRFIPFDETTEGGTTAAYAIFLSGNAGSPAGCQLYLFDNTITNNDGHTDPFFNGMSYDPRVTTAPTGCALPVGYVPLLSTNLEDVVLPNVGAFPTNRDDADARIIDEIINRTDGTFIQFPAEVGGWPSNPVIIRALTVPGSPHVNSGNGYTNLEVWLDSYSVDAGGDDVVVGGTRIEVGDDWQTKVTAGAVGDTFVVAAGVHRLQTVTPKNDQQFIGETGAIMKGSKLLTSPTVVSGNWRYGSQTQTPGTRAGVCQSGHAGCDYPEELFFDGERLEHVTTLGAVTAGTWFFDYALDQITVGSDPTGHVVETSVTTFAFTGSATGVYIGNLDIAQYASPAQGGAINGTSTSGWVIEGCTLREHHGAAVKLGTGMEVSSCSIHRSGQFGIYGSSVNDVIIDGNQIYYIQGAYFDQNTEAAGIKLDTCLRPQILNNYVHDSACHGIWCDVDCDNVTILGNTVEDNEGRGIFYEISWIGTVMNNTVSRNGFASWLPAGNLTGAGIYNNSSRGLTVNGNVLRDNADGIGAIQQSRGSGTQGTHVVALFNVHDNDVRMTGGLSGIRSDNGSTLMFAGQNNLFNNNTYTFPINLGIPGNTYFFTWNNTAAITIYDMRSNGQETTSTFTNEDF